MKKLKKKIRITTLYLIGTIILLSCVRDGRDGRDGFDGFDGRDGSANVEANTYFVIPSDWSAASFGGEVDGFNASITAQVMQSGLVQVYYSEDVDPISRRWIAMPIGDFGFSYVQSTITFEVYNASSVAYNIYYKVVVIPPSAKIDGLDLNNYEAVQAVYGIE